MQAGRRRLAEGAEVAITGRGLVGSLGLDVVTACAAFRAGINRVSLLEDYDAGGDDLEGAPLRVQAAPFITHGFEGPARLAQLLAAGFEDLSRQHPELTAGLARASYFLALPEPGRALTGAAAIPDLATREELTQLASAVEVYPVQRVADELKSRIARALPFALPTKPMLAVSAGHASTAEACVQAAAQLVRGEADLVVVASVDSLLDADTLVWLENLGRLRTEDRPAGVVAGEACAVLVLERARDARQRKARVYAELRGVELDREPKPLLSGEPSSGLVLANLVDTLHGQRGHTAAPWIILDHTGENARAAEWGNSLFHLRSRTAAAYGDSQVWYPATGFGDTGAASGAIAMCLAMAAWERKYAPSERALICSVADGPPRAVLCLETTPRR